MNMINKLCYLIVAIWGLTFSANAASLTQEPKSCCPDNKNCQQEPPRKEKFNREDFRKKLTAYMIKEAGITPNEAKQFFPLYFEMREKMRSIDRQKERALSNAAKNNMSEKDCKRVLDEALELDKKNMRLESQYMNRLQKLVGARKLTKALYADRCFGRRMFMKMTK